MSRKQSPRVLILCEDKAHKDFIMGFCEELGWSRGKIYSYIHPGDKGSAEQWVRENYVKMLMSFRKRESENVILLVMIDADKFSPEQRRTSLEQLAPRKRGEAVAVLVPARNIQSWFAYLDGNFKAEAIDLKNSYKDQPQKIYGKKMARHCKQGNPVTLPPSLEDACREWKGRIVPKMTK